MRLQARKQIQTASLSYVPPDVFQLLRVLSDAGHFDRAGVSGLRRGAREHVELKDVMHGRAYRKHLVSLSARVVMGESVRRTSVDLVIVVRGLR